MTVNGIATAISHVSRHLVVVCLPTFNASESFISGYKERFVDVLAVTVARCIRRNRRKNQQEVVDDGLQKLSPGLARSDP